MDGPQSTHDNQASRDNIYRVQHYIKRWEAMKSHRQTGENDGTYPKDLPTTARPLQEHPAACLLRLGTKLLRLAMKKARRACAFSSRNAKGSRRHRLLLLKSRGSKHLAFVHKQVQSNRLNSIKFHPPLSESCFLSTWLFGPSPAFEPDMERAC